MGVKISLPPYRAANNKRHIAINRGGVKTPPYRVK